MTDDKQNPKSETRDYRKMPERNAAFSAPPAHEKDESDGQQKKVVISDWASI